MPKGTRVHRCVDKMKKKGGGANPYAVCQKATGQSYATGKSLRSNMPDGASLSPRGEDRKSTRLNSSHIQKSRMPSSA